MSGDTKLCLFAVSSEFISCGNPLAGVLKPPSLEVTDDPAVLQKPFRRLRQMFSTRGVLAHPS
jgi:hypothetical protein